ncbi:hypothetical protein RHECIAT_CH0000992 [Rhizobium etli CIAT 652]|uniref:Uncharacterized protein n=1 Tax=Rhizobium etli (strain CIAT 652) TaxID=491916 RepID=B3PRJ4_RHIE6|nr:hypothetical protein RHECIAT_CH0000992 [Rhizobium etli CIAT 652]
MSQMRRWPASGSRPLCQTGLYAMSQLTIIAWRVGDAIDRAGPPQPCCILSSISKPMSHYNQAAGGLGD